ncbi:ABC transporter permease [Bdellovibrio bacteriovorus]|uniref:Macrolide ABC transporter ATP-binding protein n=1 Tax=Bdellovibrio bacteriovorus str. Tiberius TaxID=1069642 RepID=K7ZBJ2_BDEBC|nr:ABC transporter permease [Bdellovibrio bacteriovorus]AFY02374.1 macrolide ABC transporter ATP-binding protein [Bdellovibrio bacteriovorus str. Tiberius]
MKPLISVRNLKKQYVTEVGEGESIEVSALAGVNLDIHQGEFVAIMGPSGSGKSTLMQILGLLDRSTGGDYHLNGQNIDGLDDDQLAELRSNLIGFVFQFFNLLPRSTCIDNVALPIIYSGGENPQERAIELLKAVDLGHRLTHRPHQLSGGQQQRVAIARALANNPKIIFADEPTGNISSQQTEEVLGLLDDLNKKGVTIILVTHEPEVAKRARRLITIKDGLVVGDETLQEPRIRCENPEVIATKERAERFQWKRLRENLRMAWVSLTLNLLRTSLATLGVMIGIASFVAMVAIGEGAKKAVGDMISSLGTNILNVRAVNPKSAKGASESLRKFELHDYESLEQFSRSVPAIKSVDAQVYGDVTASYGNKNAVVELMGATPSIEAMQNFIPVMGRFFTDDENRLQARVALIGQTTAQNLFGDRNPVGAIIRINRADYQIIGLLPRKGATAYKDRDDLLIVPLKTGMHRLLGRRSVAVMTIEAADSGPAMKRAEYVVDEWMYSHRQIKNGEARNYDIRNMNDIQELYTQSTGIISSMLKAISVVALLVGGIGIMNVMFVSVKERTREVGLRKAIGGKRLDILSQFLVESVLIGLFGGVVGTVLGYLLSVAAGELLDWATLFSMSSVVVAFVFSFVVGLVFGLWPAKQASELSPIEALRYE